MNPDGKIPSKEETPQSLNDTAWAELFRKFHILDHIQEEGFFQISAGQIKEYREPRLMVKFDKSDDLPALFAEHKLAILPVSRGAYRIAHFDAYHKFEESAPDYAHIIRKSLPDWLQSLNYNCITSEAVALNCAVASGIIADFIGEDEFLSTLSGRMGSGVFAFDIHDSFSRSSRRVQVSQAQIEIDAAYESPSCLTLLEAKRDISEDFIVRQLYYPVRAMHCRGITKKVRPVFLVFSNNIYHLYEYAFENIENYSSLSLIRQKTYALEDTAITICDIQEILDHTVFSAEPEIPFPQANSFDRVINICELASERDLSRTDVTEQYDFAARQTNYYTDAARYLGLLDKKMEGRTPVYSTSDLGRKILKLPYKQRQLGFCKCILSHKAFHEAMKLYFLTAEMPSKDQIVRIMKASNLYGIRGEDTYNRRASTVQSWVEWMMGIINE